MGQLGGPCNSEAGVSCRRAAPPTDFAGSRLRRSPFAVLTLFEPRTARLSSPRSLALARTTGTLRSARSRASRRSIVLTALRAIPVYGGRRFGAIFMVAKSFSVGGCRPGFGRDSTRAGVPSFCVVIAIGLLANLVRLGSFLWGKIKRHVILHLDGCSLAIRRGPVSYITGLEVRYNVAVLRLQSNFGGINVF